MNNRSYCERCKHILSWKDLVPVLSFLFLKGKCRYCHKKLSLYYPTVEFATGVVFVATYFFTQNLPLITIVYIFFVTFILVTVFFADVKYTFIPFITVIPGIIVSYVYAVAIGVSVFPYLLSALGASLFFFLLFALTSGKGMGFGDVVYAFFMGSVLGYPKIITGLYIAFILGAIIGVLLLFLKKKKMHGATIPFGPFLVVGTYLALFLRIDILHVLFPQIV